jgi:hypothetical protein
LVKQGACRPCKGCPPPSAARRGAATGASRLLCSLARGLTTVTHRLALCRDQAISASKCVGAPAPGTGVGVYKAGQESSDRDRTAA